MFNHQPDYYVCPSCRPVAGGEDEQRVNTERDIVRRDELATAFVAPRWWPNNHGHVIVIPDAHHLVREVAIAIRQSLRLRQNEMEANADEHLAGRDHPREHDLTDRAQLRDHIAIVWTVMRQYRPAAVALFQSMIAADPASGSAWRDLRDQTTTLREHLEYLPDRHHPLPGDPQLVAAAIGAMLATSATRCRPRTSRPATTTTRPSTPSPTCCFTD